MVTTSIPHKKSQLCRIKRKREEKPRPCSGKEIRPYVTDREKKKKEVASVNRKTYPRPEKSRTVLKKGPTGKRWPYTALREPTLRGERVAERAAPHSREKQTGKTSVKKKKFFFCLPKKEKGNMSVGAEGGNNPGYPSSPPQKRERETSFFRPFEKG